VDRSTVRALVVAFFSVLISAFVVVFVYTKNQPAEENVLSSPHMIPDGGRSRLPEAVTDEAAPLNVKAWSCTFDGLGWVHVRGEVANTSRRRLDRVAVNVTFRTDDGTFVKNDSSDVDYQPILPGQVSPFSTLAPGNPAITSAELAFVFSGDGTIEFAGPKTDTCSR
jgi:hypothetical protein